MIGSLLHGSRQSTPDSRSIDKMHMQDQKNLKLHNDCLKNVSFLETKSKGMIYLLLTFNSSSGRVSRANSILPPSRMTTGKSSDMNSPIRVDLFNPNSQADRKMATSVVERISSCTL